jgi:outer membrane lipoprotein-sorting protein
MKPIIIRAACLATLAATVGSVSAAPANMSVEQIIERNIAARGGLPAWHDAKTLVMAGDIDAGGKPNHALPYILKEKRPHKSRLEIVFKDQTSTQVFDGAQGWKVRPFLNRNEVEAYTPAETKAATAAEQDLDPPLMDHAAKGTQVKLAGTDVIEGHPAYKLLLTLKGGTKRNLWIDSGSFLELKMEGEPRKMDGKMHNVAVYFRDYKSEHGLNVPHTQETSVEGYKQTYKMTITRVAVNEPIDDGLFQKPQLTAQSAAVAKPK